MDPLTKKINEAISIKLNSMANMAVPNHAHNTYDSNQIDPAIGLMGFPVIQVADATITPIDVPVNGTFRFYVDTTPKFYLWVYLVYQNSATALIGGWKKVQLT